MARRAKSGRSRKIKLEQDLKQGLKDLKSTREILRDAEQRALEGVSYKPKAFGKIPKADYRRMERLTKKFGLYDPKFDKLTPARQKTIRQKFMQLEHLVKNAVFAEYPPGASPKLKAKIKSDVRKAYPTSPAEQAYYSGEAVARKSKQSTSKRGIWLPKSERQMTAPVGQLKYDKKVGVYGVQVSKKTKSGIVATEFRYIAGSDVLEKKQGQLNDRFEKIGGLKKNQRLRFIIGRNESRRTFRNMGELFKYAARYRRDDQARATFLNELIIEVVEKGPAEYAWKGTGKRRRKSKNVWTNRVSCYRADNNRSVHPDLIREMFEENDYDEGEDE
jgi:hypothetical protein